MTQLESFAERIVVSTGASDTMRPRLPSDVDQLRGILVAHSAVSQSPVLVTVSARLVVRGTQDTVLLPLGRAWVRASSVSPSDGGHYFPVDLTPQSLLGIEVTIRNDTGADVTLQSVAVV